MPYVKEEYIEINPTKLKKAIKKQTSMASFSSMCGISQPRMSRICSGKFKPDQNEMDIMCMKLGKSINDFKK